MKINTTQHPVFRLVMVDEGRSLKWLARETKFSHPYVKAVSAGIERGSPRFRAECARVMGRPIAELFHDDAGSQASQSVDPDGSESDRAVNVVARATPYPIEEEVAISKTA